MKTETSVNSPAALALSRVSAPMAYDTFHCEEIRSLTVHLEHAGEWRVYTRTEDGPNEVFPDYFPTWDAARKVADACNAVSRAVPGASPAEVFAFFTSRTAEGADVQDDGLPDDSDPSDPRTHSLAFREAYEEQESDLPRMDRAEDY